MSYYKVFYKDPCNGNYNFIRNIKIYDEKDLETIKNDYKYQYNTNLSNNSIKIQKINFSKKETYILKNILLELNSGYKYGKDVTYHIAGKEEPGFDTALWKKINGFIGWQHFGSSSCKNNYNDLKFTLLIIFQMFPSEFIKEYKIEKD